MDRQRLTETERQTEGKIEGQSDTDRLRQTEIEKRDRQKER